MSSKPSIEHRGFRIVPKTDFGQYGYRIDGMTCREGYVVIDKAGCNALPGAVWTQTVAEAKECIEVMCRLAGDALPKLLGGPDIESAVYFDAASNFSKTKAQKFHDALRKIGVAKENAVREVLAKIG